MLFRTNDKAIVSLTRAIVLWFQIMAESPVADAGASFQPILTCRSKVNASVDPTRCRFLRCVEAR